MPRVRMKDLADKIGCSVNTVSRALKSDPGISASRREAIQALAKKLGYRPDPLVSAFCSRLSVQGDKSKYRATIGLINPLSELHSGLPLLDRIEGALRTRLFDRGYLLETFSFKEWAAHGQRFTEILKTRSIQGLAFLHFPRSHFDLDWDLSPFALVSYGYTLDTPDLHRVSENHAQAVDLALENAARLGYRKPGLVLSRYQNEVSRGIRAGRFLSWHAERGLPPPPLFYDWNNNPAQPGDLLDWFDACRPDVLLCNGSQIPRAIARHRKLRLPTGLAAIDLNLGGSHGPAAAGIDIDPEACSAAMADFLLAQLSRNERGIPSHPRISLVRSQWIDGPSCPKKIRSSR